MNTNIPPISEPEPSSPGPPFFTRVVRGGFWVFAMRMTQLLLGIVRILVLALLLGPGDLGLIWLALLTITTLTTLTETGFQAALIQRKDSAHAYLNTTWTIGIIRGIILFAVLYCTAPFLAVFFDGSPQLTDDHFADPAALLSKHESTISRAVADKFVLLPSRRLVRFEQFFAPGAAQKSIILELINREGQGRPLTDRQISRILESRGYRVARRTVAKYRQALRIPPSTQRRAG